MVSLPMCYSTFGRFLQAIKYIKIKRFQDKAIHFYCQSLKLAHISQNFQRRDLCHFLLFQLFLWKETEKVRQNVKLYCLLTDRSCLVHPKSFLLTKGVLNVHFATLFKYLNHGHVVQIFIVIQWRIGKYLYVR